MNHSPPAELDRVPCSPPLQTSAINHAAFLPPQNPLTFCFMDSIKSPGVCFLAAAPLPPLTSRPGSWVCCPGLASRFRSSSSGLGWAQAWACFTQIPFGSCISWEGLEQGKERVGRRHLKSGDKNEFPQQWPWTSVWMDSWLLPSPGRSPGLWAWPTPSESRGRSRVCALFWLQGWESGSPLYFVSVFWSPQGAVQQISWSYSVDLEIWFGGPGYSFEIAVWGRRLSRKEHGKLGCTGQPQAHSLVSRTRSSAQLCYLLALGPKAAAPFWFPHGSVQWVNNTLKESLTFPACGGKHSSYESLHFWGVLSQVSLLGPLGRHWGMGSFCGWWLLSEINQTLLPVEVREAQGASSQNGVCLWSRNTFKCLKRSNPTHLNSIHSLPFQSPSLSCLVTVVLLLMRGTVWLGTFCPKKSTFLSGEIKAGEERSFWWQLWGSRTCWHPEVMHFGQYSWGKLGVATPQPWPRGGLTHETEMDKGLLLSECFCDTTTCPKGVCGPRQASFPALWTEGHSVSFPLFA